MTGFSNISVYIKGQGIVKTNVAWEEDTIRALGEDCGKITPPKGLDLPEDFNGILVPGFIDEHVHGAAGADTMDGAHALSKIANALPKEGTTSFLATTMTAEPQETCRVLRDIASYCAKKGRGASLLGAHMEGPFLSCDYIGAQNGAYLEHYTPEALLSYVNASQNHIKLMSFAPEAEGGTELLQDLRAQGIRACAGHTAATFAQIAQSAVRGLSGITHTFNAQSPFHHREAGCVGAALLIDSLYCEVIADLLHVSVPALRLLFKSKPKDKVILITDAMRQKGLPDGISELGGQTVYVKNGEARLADGTLAGSTLKMNVAIKNIVQKAGVPFTDAIDYASFNPARHLGLTDRGQIAKGLRPDFCALDHDFNVLFTIVGGKVVYQT